MLNADPTLAHGHHEELSEVQFGTHNSKVGINNPPMRKNDRVPPKELTIQFDAFQHIFYIVIERQSRFISSDSAIIVHGKGNSSSTPNVKDIDGFPYTGRYLKVVPKPEVAAKSNQTERVEQEPLARFQVRQTGDNLDIAGGFMFEGKFYKVQQQQPTPFPMPLSVDGNDNRKQMQRVNRPNTPPILIVSRDEDNPPMYKCGSHRHNHQKTNGTSEHHADLFAAAVMANSTHDFVKEYAMMAKVDTGCPSTRKILYVSVVADCGYFEKLAGDIRAIQSNIISDFNLVSAIYEKAFNVELGLLAIHVMEECNQELWNRPCAQAASMDERLSAFSKWRAGQSKDAGLFHLVTGCLTNEVVGIAWLNQVCNVKAVQGQRGGQEADDNDIVSGTSISALIRNQFAVIAHEIGHNFGAVHDCTADVCVKCDPGRPCAKCCECGEKCDCGGRFVMSPESGGMNVSGFSECSRRDICRKMPVLASCLKEPGTFKQIGKGVCGDGIRDEGEECDCGGEEGCRGNKCCSADCKLKPGAECDPQTDKCCRDCKLIPAAERKRCSLKSSFCTEPAVCDGKSRDCPRPKQLPDGHKCPDGKTSCASGMCTSRDEQCKAIGQRLGLMRACPATRNSCRMICSGEQESVLFSTCTIIDADFIDGTECGFRGRCINGKCTEGSISGILQEFWWVWLIVGILIAGVAIIYLSRWTLAYWRRLHHRPSIILQ